MFLVNVFCRNKTSRVIWDRIFRTFILIAWSITGISFLWRQHCTIRWGITGPSPPASKDLGLGCQEARCELSLWQILGPLGEVQCFMERGCDFFMDSVGLFLLELSSQLPREILDSVFHSFAHLAMHSVLDQSGAECPIPSQSVQGPPSSLPLTLRRRSVDSELQLRVRHNVCRGGAFGGYYLGIYLLLYHFWNLWSVLLGQYSDWDSYV